MYRKPIPKGKLLRKHLKGPIHQIPPCNLALKACLSIALLIADSI